MYKGVSRSLQRHVDRGGVVDRKGKPTGQPKPPKPPAVVVRRGGGQPKGDRRATAFRDGFAAALMLIKAGATDREAWALIDGLSVLANMHKAVRAELRRLKAPAGLSPDKARGA